MFTSDLEINTQSAIMTVEERDGLGNLDNMEEFLSVKLPWFMPLPGS